MMKKVFFAWLLTSFLASCSNRDTETTETSEIVTDTSANEIIIADTIVPENITGGVKSGELRNLPDSNFAFRNISVRRLDGNEVEVRGQARIFEATVNWVTEDGHSELDSGYVTANNGAPEWGDFMIRTRVNKERDNSTVHLILYEASAKDGSRIHEMPVFLF